MKVKQLWDGFYVASQLDSDDVAALPGLGIRSILNHRPEGEASDQTPGPVIAQAALAAGLEYRAAPIATKDVTAAEVAAMRRALRELPQPVCAYCRTGTRAAIAWALAVSDRKPHDELIAALDAAGYGEAGIEWRLLDTALPADAAPAPQENTING